MKREWVEKVGGFDPNLKTQEDYDYFLRLAKITQFAFIDYPLISYRRRPQQLTCKEKNHQIIKDVYKVVQRNYRDASRMIGQGPADKRYAEVLWLMALICLDSGHQSRARKLIKKSIALKIDLVKNLLLLLGSYLPLKTVVSVRNRLKTLLSL